MSRKIKLVIIFLLNPKVTVIVIYTYTYSAENNKYHQSE